MPDGGNPVVDAARRALVKMENDERNYIIDQAITLEKNIKARSSGKVMFGRMQSIELMACLGMWMAERRKGRRSSVHTKDTKEDTKDTKELEG